MLGITRIIKHELFKQDALPDKWNDYEVGNIYTLNGEILDVPSDLNLCDQKLNTFEQPMFLIPEELPANVPWEISFKWAFKTSTYHARVPYILSIDPRSNSPLTTIYIGMDNAQAYFGKNAIPERFSNGMSGTALREFECKVYYNPETERVEYQISSNNKSKTGYWNKIPETIRPAIAMASEMDMKTADVTSGSKICLRDFKFTYNGKVLFDR